MVFFVVLVVAIGQGSIGICVEVFGATYFERIVLVLDVSKSTRHEAHVEVVARGEYFTRKFRAHLALCEALARCNNCILRTSIFCLRNIWFCIHHSYAAILELVWCHLEPLVPLKHVICSCYL